MDLLLFSRVDLLLRATVPGVKWFCKIFFSLSPFFKNQRLLCGSDKLKSTGWGEHCLSHASRSSDENCCLHRRLWHNGSGSISWTTTIYNLVSVTCTALLKSANSQDLLLVSSVVITARKQWPPWAGRGTASGSAAPCTYLILIYCCLSQNNEGFLDFVLQLLGFGFGFFFKHASKLLKKNKSTEDSVHKRSPEYLNPEINSVPRSDILKAGWHYYCKRFNMDFRGSLSKLPLTN